MKYRARAVKTAKYKLGRRMLRKCLVMCLRRENAMLPEDERASEETIALAEKVIMDRKTKVRFGVV